MVSFSIADYIVGAFVLLVPVFIGILFAVRDVNRATREEYLMGGRQMSMLPVAMSIFITFQSAVSQIGIPAEVYSHGSQYIMLGVGLSLAYLVCLNTMIPLIYPLKLTSMYEYIYLRYQSEAVRQISTCLGIFQTTCYMAVALLSPALALQTSAGIPMWLSVALVGGIGTIYTTMGGIKSVIWTDAFQTIIVFIGLATIIIKGVIEVGSVDEVWTLANEGGRTAMNSVEIDPRERHTYWGCLIGVTFLWLVNCFNQSSIQRICSMKTMRDAKISFFLNVPFVIIYCATLVVVGNIVFAYISKTECDPYKAGIVSNPNQIAPYFVLETMSDLPGMAGLYISTLCCGSLSTLSSGINALAANTVEDILRHPLKNVREGIATLITKIVVLLYGAIIIALAYGAKSLKGPVTQMAGSVFGALGSPVLGIFIVGATIPWANKYGAIVGALSSITFNLWVSVCNRLYGTITPHLPSISTERCFNNTMSFNETTELVYSFGANITFGHNYSDFSTVATESVVAGRKYGFFLYDVSYEWFSFMGTVVCVTVALIVSFLTKAVPGVSKTTDPKLIFPFLRRFWGMDETPVHVYTTSDLDLTMPVFQETDAKSVEKKKKPKPV